MKMSYTCWEVKVQDTGSKLAINNCWRELLTLLQMEGDQLTLRTLGNRVGGREVESLESGCTEGKR